MVLSVQAPTPFWLWRLSFKGAEALTEFKPLKFAALSKIVIETNSFLANNFSLQRTILMSINSLKEPYLLACILKQVILDEKNLNCARTCKQWKVCIEERVLSVFVDHLQKHLEDISQVCHLRSLITQFTQQVNLQNNTKFSIFEFKKINLTLAKALKIEPTLITSVEQINALTQIHINSWNHFWDAIKNQVNPQPAYPLITPDEISDWMNNNPDSLTSVTALNLRWKEISVLPSAIQLLTHLSVIDLSGNAFEELPIEITRLPALQILNLSNNKLKTLPPEINKMDSLQILNLSQNQLVDLPEQITQLPALRKLDLSHNKLTEYRSEYYDKMAHVELKLIGNSFLIPINVNFRLTYPEMFSFPKQSF
jgi:Leucine-rich repeat (LRR) protein